VELGLGATKTGVWNGTQRIERHWDKHAFVRIDLDKNPRPRPTGWLVMPSVQRSKLETGDRFPPYVSVKDYQVELPRR
jgi:hypothetical protein